MFRKYLCMNAEEIKEIVKYQVDEGALDRDSESDLHVLLENRKHIKQFLAEMSAVDEIEEATEAV